MNSNTTNYNEEIALIDLFGDYSRWETAGEDTQYRTKFNEDTKKVNKLFCEHLIYVYINNIDANSN